ncbi:DUF4942 domain-containing protein [Photobacterium damselae]|uniref:DUF4942 domain-containing protein n=1 Tax=Photobacterium damselae TaxID=38293 RepID=UPI001F33F78A|nr:DUF4942 domain-containing protein [Photobacterium damselae]UKA04466.1 DUF4942 domain-containing protein [Photobacterium damselae subsp. damselae]
MSKTSRLVDKLKANNEDFEWYPTTDEIISQIGNYVRKNWNEKEVQINNRTNITSILDVGAGDGRVLEALGQVFNISKSGNLFAIEKSTILQGELPNHIFVIGSDFNEQSLMDKHIDFTYSNPPYKLFESWMVKILSESDGFICMTVPSRWIEKQSIMNVIEERDYDYEIFYQTNFFDADRSARCSVDVIMFSPRSHGAFSDWFNTEFTFKKCGVDSDLEEIEKQASKKRNTLIAKNGLVNALVDFYNDEISDLQATYRNLFELDPTLLAEIGVRKDDLLSILKLKIKGIKKKYWSELINGLDEINSRLTDKSREKVISTLNNNTSVDFCVSNIHAVVLWCIRNANTHIDEQIVSLFETLMTEKAVHRYKSTKRTFVDGDWKYNKNAQNERFYLDYRFVSNNMSYYSKDVFGRVCVPTEIADKTIEHIRNICVVANTLGFPQSEECTKLEDLNLDFNQAFVLEYKDSKTKEIKPLVKFRLYKNHNIHFNFSPLFMAKLNVEFGRLKGWVADKKEAYDCMETMFSNFGISEFEAHTMFTSAKYMKLEKSELLRLGSHQD